MNKKIKLFNEDTRTNKKNVWGSDTCYLCLQNIQRTQFSYSRPVCIVRINFTMNWPILTNLKVKNHATIFTSGFRLLIFKQIYGSEHIMT